MVKVNIPREGIDVMEQKQPRFGGVPIDRLTISPALLNIDNKERSNLLPWNGQFSPQLVEVLLRTYAPRNGLVFDPFAGSGTVLYEVGNLGMPVVGSEINPAACKMAQIYCMMNLPLVNRKRLADELEKTIHESLPDQDQPLFCDSGCGKTTNVKETLIAIHSTIADEATRSMLEALIVLADFYKDPTAAKVWAKWGQLKSMVLNLAESKSRMRLLNCDARHLPLNEDEIDFVLTSPPYINVFNYHQQYRRSVEALGWDLLVVARSEIGSNRKHRQNRFLTVLQYCLDMTEALRELQRVCKEGSRIVMVVGRESNVRKTRFFNGEIMADLASRCMGFAVVSRQERRFLNRFGEWIYEDLLHFEVRKGEADRMEMPSDVGREILSSAKERAPDESLADLEEALSLAGEVRASPTYDGAVAKRRSSGSAGRWKQKASLSSIVASLRSFCLAYFILPFFRKSRASISLRGRPSASRRFISIPVLTCHSSEAA